MFWRHSLIVVSQSVDGNALNSLRRERVYKSRPLMIHQEDLSFCNGILNCPPGTEIDPCWGIRGRSLLLKRFGTPCVQGRGVLVSMYAGSSDSGQHAESAHCNYYMGGTGCRALYVASPTQQKERNRTKKLPIHLNHPKNSVEQGEEASFLNVSIRIEIVETEQTNDPFLGPTISQKRYL